jgi:hypothetical protein
MKKATDLWPSIYKSLKDTFKEKFVLVNPKMAALNLALAAIAQEMQAMKKFHSKEQLERIEKLLYLFIATQEFGTYAINEIKHYGDYFKEMIRDRKTSEEIIIAIPSRLVHRWLGENISNFAISINKKEGLSPMLIMSVTSVLTAFLGSWKLICENFVLVDDL